MRLYRTRRRIKRFQKGGSVPFLNADALGYSDPAAIKRNMDLFTISCHGQTTDDNVFFVVPPHTYLMFVAHSGVVGKGNDPAMSPYVMYTGDRSTYYPKLHTLLFQPYGARAVLGPIYEETLYIYEPGDIIPDYTLQFQNSQIFMFMHGVYRLPIGSISGGNTPRELYLSRPLYYIKKALERGELIESDLAELNARDTGLIHSASDEVLETTEGIPNTKDFRKTALFQKLETLCCRGPENLLTKPPFGLDMLRKSEYVLRLSTILQLLPKDPAKRDRFFFMGFCRVSYADIAEEYDPESQREPIKIPRLLRTLSFGAKCGGLHGKDTAFNVFKLVDFFCSLSTGIKSALLQYSPIRKSIALLKKGSSLSPSRWKTCLEGSYLRLNTENRINLVSSMKGYFTIDDILELSSFYTELQSILEELPRTLPNNHTNTVVDVDPAVKAALLTFSKSFKTLYEQLQAQTEVFRLKYEEKKALINSIYTLLFNKYTPYVRLPRDADFLEFGTAQLEELKRVKEIISAPEFNKEIQQIVNTHTNTNGDLDFSREDAIKDLQHRFEFFKGQRFLYHIPGPFPNIETVNTSISFDNLEPSLNLNSSYLNKNDPHYRKHKRTQIELLNLEQALPAFYVPPSTREEKLQRKVTREARELENVQLALANRNESVVTNASTSPKPNTRKARKTRKASHI